MRPLGSIRGTRFTSGSSRAGSTRRSRRRSPALVVDHHERGEVLDLDLPDRLHSQLGVLHPCRAGPAGSDAGRAPARLGLPVGAAGPRQSPPVGLSPWSARCWATTRGRPGGAGFDRAGFHIDVHGRRARCPRAGPAPGGTRSPNAAPRPLRSSSRRGPAAPARCATSAPVPPHRRSAVTDGRRHERARLVPRRRRRHPPIRHSGPLGVLARGTVPHPYCAVTAPGRSPGRDMGRAPPARRATLRAPGAGGTAGPTATCGRVRFHHLPRRAEGHQTP